MEPLGINILPTHYVIGIDCYWKNGTPVNEKYWSWFKQMQDNLSDGFIYQAIREKPMAFSEDLINETFNPVCHMATNVVLRDSVFSFRAWIKNVDVMNLITLHWDDQKHSFILYLPSHKK